MKKKLLMCFFCFKKTFFLITNGKQALFINDSQGLQGSDFRACIGQTKGMCDNTTIRPLRNRIWPPKHTLIWTWASWPLKG